jgi:hypothetical protein
VAGRWGPIDARPDTDVIALAHHWEKAQLEVIGHDGQLGLDFRVLPPRGPDESMCWQAALKQRQIARVRKTAAPDAWTDAGTWSCVREVTNHATPKGADPKADQVRLHAMTCRSDWWPRGRA